MCKDEVMIKDGALESKPTKYEKLEELGENSSVVEQPPNLKDNNELS